MTWRATADGPSTAESRNPDGDRVAAPDVEHVGFEPIEESLVVLVDLQRLATRYETSDREPLEAFLSTVPVHALDDPRASYVQTDDTTDGGYGELYDLAGGVELLDDVAGEPTKCAQDVREYVRSEHGLEAFTSYEVFLGTE